MFHSSPESPLPKSSPTHEQVDSPTSNSPLLPSNDDSTLNKANGLNRKSTEGSSSTANTRFRLCAQKIQAAQRIVSSTKSTLSQPQENSRQSLLSSTSKKKRYEWNFSNSLEPGVNPHQPQPQLDHLKSLPIKIDVIDYDEAKVQFNSFHSNFDLKKFDEIIGGKNASIHDISNTQEENDQEYSQGQFSPDSHFSDHKNNRPNWSAVRWINLSGLNWEVIRSLAIKYNLHPLAIEDCLHASARSKSEYYKNHLFVHAGVHYLGNSNNNDHNEENNKNSPPTDSEGEHLDRHNNRHNTLNFYGYRNMMDLTTATSSNSNIEKDAFDSEDREVIRRLTNDYKVRIQVEKLSIFLLRDGTLITIFSNDGSRTISPILDRLKSSYSLLRSSSDPSMLLQALLDIIVDQALDVVESLRSQLIRLQSKVLISPNLDTVKHLHILSGELILLKRTLSPLSSLVHGIINHDSSNLMRKSYSNHNNFGDHRLNNNHKSYEELSYQKDKGTDENQGFISPQTKIYLSDVLDHIDSLLSSLDLFSGLASNLVDFTFNTMSFSTNESMKHLSIITIVFLPLTFLTGYFGMNFVDFHLIQGSDKRFWYLALPITIFLVLLFTVKRLNNFFFRINQTWLKSKTSRKQNFRNSNNLG